MNTEDLKNKWNQLRRLKAYQQRLDPEHPMNFFAGCNEEGKDELILITESEPAEMKSSKELRIDKRRRQTDGRWATQIILADSSNADIFAKLCVDLLDFSRNCSSEQDGLTKVARRFSSWQKLFASGSKGMTESVMKGLIGELTFALNYLSKSFSWDEIVESWLGPEGGDRDYVMNNSWYEVKAIATGKNYITISSLNQLEVNEEGYLVQYFVDRSNKMDDKAFTLSSVVSNVRSACKNSPVTLEKLSNKLLGIGYFNQDNPEDLYFTCSNAALYKVGKDFPRLITESVPVGIIGARYDISLALIEKWRVE